MRTRRTRVAVMTDDDAFSRDVTEALSSRPVEVACFADAALLRTLSRQRWRELLLVIVDVDTTGAWQFVRENPGRTLVLAGKKLARYWSPVPNAPQFSAWWMKLAVALFYTPLMVLAVCGCWRFRRQIWLLALTAGPIVYFAAIHAVFVGSLRYRLPAEYPLAVLAAATAVALRTSRYQPLTTDH